MYSFFLLLISVGINRHLLKSPPLSGGPGCKHKLFSYSCAKLRKSLQSVCINICANYKSILKRVILKILRSVRHSTFKAEAEAVNNLTESRTFYNRGTNWRISLPGLWSWQGAWCGLGPTPWNPCSEALWCPGDARPAVKWVSQPGKPTQPWEWGPAPQQHPGCTPLQTMAQPIATLTKWGLNPSFSHENDNRLQGKTRFVLVSESCSCIIC